MTSSTQTSPALVAAMMQPPVLVPVGRRFDFDDAILLFSHVEIWPWRLMLRAAHASRRVPPPMKVPLTPEGELDKEAAKAMVSERRGLGHPLTASWMSGWEDVDCGAVLGPVCGGCLCQAERRAVSALRDRPAR